MSDHYSLMQGRKFAMTFARKVFEEAGLPSSRCDVDSLHSTQDLAGSAGIRISMFIEPAQDLVSQGQFSDSATLDTHSAALTWVVTHRGIMENENSALVTTCALKLKSLIDGNATVPSELVDGVELQVQRGAVAPSTSYYGVEKQYYHIFARNSSTIAASGSDAGSMNPPQAHPQVDEAAV
jgi:hypothetical protein